MCMSYFASIYVCVLGAHEDQKRAPHTLKQVTDGCEPPPCGSCNYSGSSAGAAAP